MREATGMTNLVTCKVHHCLGAQAVSVSFPTGFKFSYSGDCRPSRTFVRMGQGSTVVVHEATFDDEMQSDAEAKKHSTMTEAISVARAMNAQQLVLTHFSQRYQKIAQISAPDEDNVRFEDVETASEGEEDNDMVDDPEPLGPAINFGHHASPSRTANAKPLYTNRDVNRDLKVAIAFDFLRVRVRDIAYLEQLTPVLQQMFQILDEDGKAKAKDSLDELARKTKEGKEQMLEERTEQNTKAKKKKEDWDADKRRRGPSEKMLLLGESQTSMSPSEKDGKVKAKDSLGEHVRKTEEEEDKISEERTQQNTTANETDQWNVYKTRRGEQPQSGASQSGEDDLDGLIRRGAEWRRVGGDAAAPSMRLTGNEGEEVVTEAMQLGVDGKARQESGQESSSSDGIPPLPLPEVEQAGSADTIQP